MTSPKISFAIGDTAHFTKIITMQDVQDFARISGDTQPIHIDNAYSSKTRFKTQIAHGVISIGLISAVLGVKMARPDHTLILLGSNIQFIGPVHLNDTITAECKVLSIRNDKPIVTLSCKCINQHNDEVATGEATIFVDPFPYSE